MHIDKKLIFSFCLLLGTIPNSSKVLANPFVPTPPYVDFEAGNGIPKPHNVPGKGYSDNLDQNDSQDPPNTSDSQQVIHWNGRGGRQDAFFDYNGEDPDNPERNINTPVENGQVDALAQNDDALFFELEIITNQAALLFSVEENDKITPNNGEDSENIWFESVSGDFGLWAIGNGGNLDPLNGNLISRDNDVDDIDGDNDVADIDGLEMWGPDDTRNDADRFSLEGDPLGTSIFLIQDTMEGHEVIPYISTNVIAEAIDPLFPNFSIEPGDIDLDAMMNADRAGERNSFDFGDWIMFSVAPIDGNNDGMITNNDGTIDVDGGEIFVFLGGSTQAFFLNHGGHLWDTAFRIMDDSDPNTLDLGLDNENINALEAVAVPTPEPSSLICLSLFSLGGIFLKKKNGTKD